MGNNGLVVTLITFSIISCIVIIVGVVTPGWYGLKIKDGSNNNVKVYSSPFYILYCGSAKCSSDLSKDEVQMVVDIMGYKIFKTGEATLTLIGIFIGCVLTVIFGVFQLSRKYRNGLTGFAVSGLVLTLCGWIFAAILTMEYIDYHHDYDWTRNKSGEDNTIPYSLIIMAVGLVLEGISIILTIIALMNIARKPLVESRYIREPVVRRLDVNDKALVGGYPSHYNPVVVTAPPRQPMIRSLQQQNMYYSY